MLTWRAPLNEVRNRFLWGKKCELDLFQTEVQWKILGQASARMHARTHKCKPLHKLIYVHRPFLHILHTYTHAYTYAYKHSYVHTHTYTYVRKYMRTYICTYIHTYIYTYMRAYVRPYIRSRVQKFPAWHTKAAPNGKCLEGYIVPSMMRLMYQLKKCVEIKGDYVEK